jgi:hypothetical protein
MARKGMNAHKTGFRTWVVTISVPGHTAWELLAPRRLPVSFCVMDTLNTWLQPLRNYPPWMVMTAAAVALVPVLWILAVLLRGAVNVFIILLFFALVTALGCWLWG